MVIYMHTENHFDSFSVFVRFCFVFYISHFKKCVITDYQRRGDERRCDGSGVMMWATITADKLLKFTILLIVIIIQHSTAQHNTWGLCKPLLVVFIVSGRFLFRQKIIINDIKCFLSNARPLVVNIICLHRDVSFESCVLATLYATWRTMRYEWLLLLLSIRWYVCVCVCAHECIRIIHFFVYFVCRTLSLLSPANGRHNKHTPLRGLDKTGK